MSLTLNGSQGVQIADAAVLTLPDGDWSWQAWVKIADNSGAGTWNLLSWGVYAGTPSATVRMYQASSAFPNKLRSNFEDGDGDNVVLTSTGTPGASSAWQHWAVVRSGNTVTQYVDGVADGNATNADFDAVDKAADEYVGCYNTGLLGLVGKLAESAKWSRALSGGELAALAAGAPPGDYSTNLDWWLPLVDDKESDAGGLTTSLVGSPSWDSGDHPVAYSSAIELDVDPIAAAASIVPPVVVHNRALSLDPLAVAAAVVPPAVVHNRILAVDPVGITAVVVPPAVAHNRVIDLDPLAIAVSPKNPWVTSRARYPRPRYNGTIAVGGGL